MRVAVPPRVRAGHERVLGDVDERRESAVEQRDLDQLAVPAPVTSAERSDDRRRRVEAGEHVDDRDADLHRRPVRLARDRHQAGLGLDDEVVAGSVAGLATAEAIDRAIDHVRSAPSDGVIVEAEASCSARAEVLDHHIGARTQLERELPSFRIL
jgi:hypothetical protein